MVKEAIATGATTEEAYEKSCAMLGVDPADAEFEVLETEEKKRFGLFGGRPAKVRAFIRSTPADAAAEYLRNVLSGMGLGDVNIEIREEEAGAELVLTGENIGFIIGHRGEQTVRRQNSTVNWSMVWPFPSADCARIPSMTTSSFAFPTTRCAAQQAAVFCLQSCSQRRAILTDTVQEVFFR